MTMQTESPPNPAASAPDAAFVSHTFGMLSVGMRDVWTRHISESDVFAFAHLSGDHNPLHLDEDFARQTRFEGRIVHGMFTASLLSGALGTRLPGMGAIYLSQTLNFRRPVRIGDTVTVVIEVLELIEKGARCRLSTTAFVDGEVVMDGEALAKVPV
jgi:3-hydroxybutyryl-CoA dehydratase